MTLSNLATFSGVTDNSPATPSYLNSKFSQLVSMITAVNSVGTDFGAITSGSTTTFPNDARFILRSYDSGGYGVNLRAFGAAGDGSIDDTDAVRSAISAALNNGTELLLVPGGFYKLTSTITLSSPVHIAGAGGYGTVIFRSHHSDDMFRVSSRDVGFRNIAIVASSSSTGYSMGRAIFVTGGAATLNFSFVNGSIDLFDGVKDSARSGSVVFDDDSGGNSHLISSRIVPYTISASTQANSISMGSDTAARQRYITNISCGGGIISAGSAQDTFITASFPSRVEMNAGSFGLNVQGCRLGNSGSTMTLRGGANFFVGNSFSGSVVLDSSFTGVFVGNDRSGTNYKLISNANSANALIVDRELVSVPSGCTVDLNQGRLVSIRTLPVTSLTSANLIADEIGFALSASGASLAIRSGGTVWYFSSSLSTNG